MYAFKFYPLPLNKNRQPPYLPPGRFVFGTGDHFSRMKTVALSTQVDAVTDDAIPNIHLALKANGIEPRPYMTGAPPSGNGEGCPFKK